MDRISATGYILNGAGQRVFQNQNLAAGVNGTDCDAKWLTGAQESIIEAVEAAGLVPTDTDNTQLTQAIEHFAAVAAGPAAYGASSIAPAGYLTFGATGLILQWGLADLPAWTDNSVCRGPVVFPIPFPNALFCISLLNFLTVAGTGGKGDSATVGAVSATKTGFVGELGFPGSASSGATITWLALGN
jgi:hypothetical protein